RPPPPLGGGARDSAAARGRFGAAAYWGHGREPLGAARRRGGGGRLRLLGHAAGREIGAGPARDARRRHPMICGRYELHTNPAAIALAFGLARTPDLHARYNIAPM